MEGEMVPCYQLEADLKATVGEGEVTVTKAYLRRLLTTAIAWRVSYLGLKNGAQPQEVACL